MLRKWASQFTKTTELRTDVICSSKHRWGKIVAITSHMPLVAGLELQAQLRLVHSILRVLRNHSTMRQWHTGISLGHSLLAVCFTPCSISRPGSGNQILRSWTLVKQLFTLNTYDASIWSQAFYEPTMQQGIKNKYQKRRCLTTRQSRRLFEDIGVKHHYEII